MKTMATATRRAQQAGSQSRGVRERGLRERGVRGGLGKMKRKGQALIEMALVVMVLITLSMGIVQFGIIYATVIQVTNLAREGARFGAIHGTETNVETQIETYVRAQAAGTTIKATDLPDGNITVTVPSRTEGQPLTVIVTYDMTRKFFIPRTSFGFLADANNRWSRFSQQATMTIE